MKKRIMFWLTFIVLSCNANCILAQDTAARSAGYDVKKAVKCRVAATADGCSIVFENAIVSARESSSGMATGKRLHEPMIIVKEYRVSANDNSVLEVTSPRDMATGQASGRVQASAATSVETSSLGVGKVAMQDFHFTINSGGNKRELPSANGECDLPKDLPDGKYAMTVSWSWGLSQSGGISSGGRAGAKGCTVSFLVDIKDGSYMAINEKGLPGDKKPNKGTK